jgi:chromosome partitioning protein
MIIAPLISQKGGAGKTLISASLSAALAIRGYRVWLIDLDPNATLSKVMGIGNPTGVNGALTYIMGFTKSIKVHTATMENNTIANVKVIPPGTTSGINPDGALPSTPVLTSRFSSLINGIGNYRVRPNFVLIDTPTLNPTLNPSLTASLINIANLLILVTTDEPGGSNWVGSLLEYALTITQGRRQEYVVIMNKLINIKGGFDMGARYMVRILRNPGVEAAWRVGSIPYLIRDPELNQFRRAIDELASILEKINAELTWVTQQ